MSPPDEEGDLRVDTVTPNAIASTNKAPTARARPIPTGTGERGK